MVSEVVYATLWSRETAYTVHPISHSFIDYVCLLCLVLHQLVLGLLPAHSCQMSTSLTVVALILFVSATCRVVLASTPVTALVFGPSSLLQLRRLVVLRMISQLDTPVSLDLPVVGSSTLWQGHSLSGA